jgi:hypothetical protein
LARICSIGLEKPIHPEKVKRHVSSLLETVTNCAVVEAEVETSQGIRTVTLISEKLVSRSIRKFNEELADKVAEAGTRVFMHRLAGYQFTSTAVQARPEVEMMREVLELQRDLSDRLRKVEKHLGIRGELKPLVKRIEPGLSKQEQLRDAWRQILEVRDRWCEEMGITKITEGDYAFAQAVAADGVPEITHLLQILKWGDKTGLSSPTIARMRRKFAKGQEVRNLDRPKVKAIESNPEWVTWLTEQLLENPGESKTSLLRRFISKFGCWFGLSTLTRWAKHYQG